MSKKSGLPQSDFSICDSPARYMQTLFKKEADGKYHAVCGTGYEGRTLLRDATTELACGKALFRAVLEALSQVGRSVAEQELWRDILDNAAPYILDYPDKKFVADGKICTGAFAGEVCDDFPFMASGFGIEEKRNMFAREQGGIFPTADKAAVFPSGDIGIKDRGSDIYRAAVNTARGIFGNC